MRAAFFDLDGTLVDTEWHTGEALARVLARGGHTLTAAERAFVVGHSWREIHALLGRSHPGLADALPLPALMAAAAAERRTLLGHIEPLPGAIELVERLAQRIPVAVVSGASRREIAQAIAALGIGPHLAFTLGAEDVLRGKPAPDGYLDAARRLGVPPADCLVLEDSTAGIAAALAAGMRCVAVRHANFARQDQSAAHLVVDTCRDVTDALLASLWAAPWRPAEAARKS